MAAALYDRARRWPLITLLSAAALLLAACGDTLQTAAERLEDLPDFVEPEVVDEQLDPESDEGDPVENEPAENEPVENEPTQDDADDADDARGENGEDGEDAEAESSEPSQAPDDAASGLGPDRCALVTSPQAQVQSEADYLEVIGEVNLGLEGVVADLDAALADLEAGISDGPSLATELEVLLDRYQQLTAEVPQLAPLAGAEDWHADAVGRFEAVCAALLDGLVGIEEGDEERFAAFVAALREFPTLGNDLHATMMVGPFEAG